MSYDPRDMTTVRYNQAETVRRARQAMVDRERAARALAQDIIAARIERGRGFAVPVSMRLITLLDRQRGSATIWTRSRGPCAVGTTIYTGPIVTELDELSWVHEYIHATTPRCPQTGRHQRTILGGAAACVECEILAWRGTLAHLPWSPPTRDEIARCLRSYLNRISAPADVRREATRYINGTAWCIAQHRQLEKQIRLEKYREIQQWTF